MSVIKERVYDKPKYHYGRQFPSVQTMEQALVHTGMYLGWVIDAGHCSEEFSRGQELISEFRARRSTGPEVHRCCDGCFTENMLNEEGIAFSQVCFDIENGRTLADYEDTLCKNLPSFYHVKNTWENYDKLEVIKAARFLAWKNKEQAETMDILEITVWCFLLDFSI